MGIDKTRQQDPVIELQAGSISEISAGAFNRDYFSRLIECKDASFFRLRRDSKNPVGRNSSDNTNYIYYPSIISVSDSESSLARLASLECQKSRLKLGLLA